ncbi:MAG: hypothetical protein ABL925_04475, partial [Methylococcales bacterium]
AWLLSAILLVVQHNSAGLIIQFLLGKLTYSTSNGAALFMLSMCCLAVLVLRFNQAPNRYTNAAVVALPVLLLIGFVLHGLSVAYYLLHFDLPFGAYFLHWRDGANSYTSPFHSHLGKVAIAFMAQLLRLPVAGNTYDMGGVFRTVIPDSVAAALSLCFVLGSIATLSALPSISRRYAGYPALLVLYVCAATAALKNMLDGGFLAQPAPVVLVLLVFLSIAKDAAQLRKLLIKYRRHGLIVIAVALLPLINNTGEGIFPNLTELLVALAVLMLVLVVSLNKKLGKLGWSTALYLLAAILIDAKFNLLPLLRPLGQDANIYRVTDASRQPITANLPAHQQYRQLGDSAVKSRWLLVANQQQGLRELLYFIRPLNLAGRQGEFKVDAAFTDISMRQLPKNPNWLALYAKVRDDLPPARVDGIGDVFSRNNAYVYTHAIAGMLTASGFSEFIMLPATSTNAIPVQFRVL